MSETPLPSIVEETAPAWRRQLLLPVTAAAGYVTTTSALLACGLAIAVVVGLAFAAGAVGYGLGGLVLGVLFALSIASIGSEHVLGSIAGAIGVLTTVLATAGLVFVSVSGGNSGAGMLLGAGVLVGFGSIRFRFDAFGGGAIARAIGVLLRIAITFFLLGLLGTLLRIEFAAIMPTAGPGGLGEVLAPTTEAGLIAGFVVVAWAAVIGVWLVATVVPPAAAVPPAVRAPYQRLTTGGVRAVGVGLGAGSIVAVFVVFVSTHTGVAGSLIEPTLGVLVAAPGVRTAFLRVFVTGLFLTGLIVIGRALGTDIILGRTKWSLSGALTAVGLTGVVVLGAGPAVETLLGITAVTDRQLVPFIEGIGATATGLFAGSGLVLAVATGLSLAPALVGVGLLPTATAGPRLVAGGLFVAAIAAATIGLPALAVFVAVTAGIVVWDLAVFGTEAIADLGHAASNRDAELLHAAASLAIGGVAVIGTTITHRLLVSVAVPTDSLPVVLVVATVAVLLLSLLLVVGHGGSRRPMM